jgi:hypothetical protein
MFNDNVVLEPLDYDVKETEKTIVQRIFEYTAKFPEDIAIIAQEKKTTYQELSDMILSINNWLRSIGIVQKDSVVIEAVHEDIYIACCYAVNLVGAKSVPVEARAPIERIYEIASDTMAKVIISIVPDSNKDVRWVSYDEIKSFYEKKHFYSDMDIDYPDIDLPCEIMFTTGTTGKSKGVIMTHRHLSWYVYSVAKAINMKKNNRFLITAPLNHAGGLRKTHLSLANGCCVVYLDGIGNLSKYYEYIMKYGVTSLYLPPVAIMILISRTGKEISRYNAQIDFVYSSSSPMQEKYCRELKHLLPSARLYNAYEASETPGVSVYDYNVNNMKKNCIGKANEGVCFGILNKDGEIMNAPGVQGRLCIKSKMNMKEYNLEPELTQSVLKDGWFVSSDLGYLDEEGNAYYNGRKGNVINFCGYKVSPEEVEETALLSGLITECICIECFDKFGYQYLKLLVVVDDIKLFDPLKIIKFLSSKLEGYKIPYKIEVVDFIHKTFNGKLDRKFYRVEHI